MDLLTEKHPLAEVDVQVQGNQLLVANLVQVVLDSRFIIQEDVILDVLKREGLKPEVEGELELAHFLCPYVAQNFNELEDALLGHDRVLKFRECSIFDTLADV